MYSHVICIGDSYTNEHQHYDWVGISEQFKTLNYEFKSYPQILGEYYGVKWETFGAPGMPMHYWLQCLIRELDYILSLENPLVIYQFGFFDNVVMSTTGGYFSWKDVVDGTNNEVINNALGGSSENNSKVLEESRHTVWNRNFQIDNVEMSDMDKLTLVSFCEKFGRFANYHLIEQFLSIADMVKKMKGIDIYGVFFANNKVIVPKHNNILYFGESGYQFDEFRQEIGEIYPQFQEDGHKTTFHNVKIAQGIHKQLLKKTDLEKYLKENPLKDGLI